MKLGERSTTWGSTSCSVLALLCAGCIPALPLRHLSLETERQVEMPQRRSAEVVRVQHTQPAEPSPITLDELLQLAVLHHPDLQAAHARVEAARGRMIQAGLYPNPAFGPNIGQLGNSSPGLGEAGARFMQTIVTGNKLGLAKAAAAHGVEAADWQAITKWHDVVARVRLAYFEVLTARRERDTLGDIVRASEEALKTATTLEKTGAGARPDVLRATVEFEQNRLKEQVAHRRVDAAWQNLLTAIGRPALALDRLPQNRKELEHSPPDYDWQRMLHCLRETSAELHEARSLIAQQEKVLARAKADVKPDLSLQVNPFYNSDAREFRAQVIMTAPVPLFDRNQGNIRAAQADLARTQAEERQLELRLTEKLTGAYQRYQSARQQVNAYRDIIVPRARESVKLIEAGYRGGDKKYDYTAVLQVQQSLFQAQLAETQSLGELWRAVVEIASILQQNDLNAGCGIH